VTIYDRLHELELELPAAPEPAGAYVPAKISRGLIFASGQTPTVEGEPVYRHPELSG
jgi:enamine deaminase RidA (YjgF/YER057c/UK114 family)